MALQARHRQGIIVPIRNVGSGYGYSSRRGTEKRRPGVHVHVDRPGQSRQDGARRNARRREAQVTATLRRQGIKVVKVRKQTLRRGGTITDKDITFFTRQLATMMKSGVPLLQAFDIVGKGHSNAAVQRLLADVKTEVETGSSLKQAFAKHPLYFDALFVNLVGAGEQAGILDTVLDRLATYKEKILAIKNKIKSALFYPIAVIVVAIIITAVIMIFVIPAFKNVFASFGADLPGPTLIVMAISISSSRLVHSVRGHRPRDMDLLLDVEAIDQDADRHGSHSPAYSDLRRTDPKERNRALDANPCHGSPRVFLSSKALDSVAGAAGNYEYYAATKKIQTKSPRVQA